MKKKWTFVDTLIVILVVVAGFALVKVFGVSKATGDMKKIEAVVLLAKEDPEVADAIAKAKGEAVTISLTEKDAGTLKEVKSEDAKAMTYNSIDGKYVIESVEGKKDIYATVTLEVAENDYAFTCGSTVIKVGESIPFRGKGYALEGYVVSISE